MVVPETAQTIPVPGHGVFADFVLAVNGVFENEINAPAITVSIKMYFVFIVSNLRVNNYDK
jgi:hypothetical protein